MFPIEELENKKEPIEVGSPSKKDNKGWVALFLS